MMKSSIKFNRDSEQSKTVSRKLRMLFYVFLFGFFLQGLIHLSDGFYSQKLDEQIENARVQGLLGNEMVSHIKRLEQLFFQISSTYKTRAREIKMRQVNQHFEQINNLMHVLEYGGDYIQTLELNLPDQNNIRYQRSFQPIRQLSFDIIRIDIEPKLLILQSHFRQMNQKVERVNQAFMSNTDTLPINRLVDVQNQLKVSTTQFIRLLENTNRIQFQQQNYLKSLEEEVARQKQFFKSVQFGSILALLMLEVWVFILISRHIRSLAEDLDLQRNKALEATRSKSLFLANMSHEIRTPLNAVMGFLSLLKEIEKDKTKLKYIKTINHSSDTLLGIINDVLDFSKIENNRLELDCLDFNPFEEFQSVADLFKAKASEKNIVLVVNMGQEIPKSLHSDPLRIKQVISNLLSNAIKFTPEGKQIELNIFYQEDNLNVSVVDHGIGIHIEKKAHIFEAFSQAEASTTRNFGGTGLGLAISKHLVEMLGGELSLRSEFGQGCEFKFVIPAKEGKPLARENLVETYEFEFKGKVLLVEDNNTNQLLMSAILRKMHIEFDIANDGVEGVQAYKNEDYALILMDENMPNMSGSDATKEIRNLEAEKEGKHVPIIALTANAMKGDREKFLKSGMDEYLSKPINIKKLSEVLQYYS